MKNLFVIPGKTEELSGLTTLTTNLKANVPVVLAREGFLYFLWQVNACYEVGLN